MGGLCSFELPDPILINSRLCRLTLGGGYGWLSGSYGLAIDNLVQVNRA